MRIYIKHCWLCNISNPFAYSNSLGVRWTYNSAVSKDQWTQLVPHNQRWHIGNFASSFSRGMLIVHLLKRMSGIYLNSHVEEFPRDSPLCMPWYIARDLIALPKEKWYHWSTMVSRKKGSGLSLESKNVITPSEPGCCSVTKSHWWGWCMWS